MIDEMLIGLLVVEFQKLLRYCMYHPRYVDQVSAIGRSR